MMDMSIRIYFAFICHILVIFRGWAMGARPCLQQKQNTNVIITNALIGPKDQEIGVLVGFHINSKPPKHVSLVNKQMYK